MKVHQNQHLLLFYKTSNILPNLTFNSKEEEENVSSLFTFRDILKKKTIYTIKSNVVKNNIEKEKHTKINSSNFRTIYQLRTPIDNLMKLLFNLFLTQEI